MADEKFFYANGSEIGIGPYDLTLKFLRTGTADPRGQLMPRSEGAPKELAPIALDSMQVSMSPSHGKAILVGLAEALIQYEIKHGTIPCLPETQKKYDDYFGRK